MIKLVSQQGIVDGFYNTDLILQCIKDDLKDELAKENDQIIKNRIKNVGKFLSKYLKEPHRNVSEISEMIKHNKRLQLFKKINKYEQNNPKYINAQILREKLSKQIN